MAETRSKPMQHGNSSEKFACDQILIQHDFSSFNMIFFIFLLLIQNGIFVMLDEMLDPFN